MRAEAPPLARQFPAEKTALEQCLGADSAEVTHWLEWVMEIRHQFFEFDGLPGLTGGIYVYDHILTLAVNRTRRTVGDLHLPNPKLTALLLRFIDVQAQSAREYRKLGQEQQGFSW
jgi:hypothetical protein